MDISVSHASSNFTLETRAVLMFFRVVGVEVDVSSILKIRLSALCHRVYWYIARCLLQRWRLVKQYHGRKGKLKSKAVMLHAAGDVAILHAPTVKSCGWL